MVNWLIFLFLSLGRGGFSKLFMRLEGMALHVFLFILNIACRIIYLNEYVAFLIIFFQVLIQKFSETFLTIYALLCLFKHFQELFYLCPASSYYLFQYTLTFLVSALQFFWQIILFPQFSCIHKFLEFVTFLLIYRIWL